MQEDKEPVFDAADTLSSCIAVFTEMLRTVKIKTDNMAEAAKTGFMNATDAADYLVKKGIPFRECHEIIGRIVLYCVENETAIEELPLDKLRSFSEKFESDVYEKITPLACMNAKVSEGSTSVQNVLEQIGAAKAYEEKPVKPE
jgi:argininosuccinate lyase